MIIFHDSRDKLYRSPAGALKAGTTVKLSLIAPKDSDVTLRLWIDSAETLYKMIPGGDDLFSYDLKLPDDPCVVWYYFIIKTADGSISYYGNQTDNKGGTGAIYDHEPPGYQITVYSDYDTPHWMRNGVMMQIMVDRFCSSGKKSPRGRLRGLGYYHDKWDEPPCITRDINGKDLGAIDFFGGDLKGLTSKLPYLKEMGISVLYLNPVFQAASNHKYDACDYMKIDPSFGSESDFRHMCDVASRLGIHIMLDGVFSHTGADSRYFNKRHAFKEPGAYQSRDSRYYSWYTFKNWPDDYEAWWGFLEHPNVNELNPGYMDYIIGSDNSVISHWMKCGASGWRLDVADELPMEFIRAIRKREKAIDKDSALLGEVWEDPSNKIAYSELRNYCLGDTLDSTMNYVLRNAVISFMTGKCAAYDFKRTVDSLMENIPSVFFYSMMNMLGSHDKPRIINVMADCGDMEPPREQRNAGKLKHDDFERGARRSLAAWRFLCAFPGMPSVYYGDDAGLQGMGDPFCRGTYPWNDIDMNIQAVYRESIRVRRENQVLRTGFCSLHATTPDLIILKRYFKDGKDAFGNEASGDSMYLALNRSAQPCRAELDGRRVILPAESAGWLK